MKLYTRTGDGGQTGLLSGGRVSKADPRVDAYGSVDEANACVGVARVEVACLPAGTDRDFLLETLDVVQDGLMRLCSDLASGGTYRIGIDEDTVAALERRIDAATALLPELRNFLVPGASRAESALHVARTVVRRAERRVVALGEDFGPSAMRLVFLNRVSDLMFALARAALRAEGLEPRVWKP
jgi:cob(I)alamin adenosyltransferase